MDAAAADEVTVDVACATPDHQCVVTVTLPAGSTAREAVVRARLPARFPDLDVMSCALGIWGVVCDDDQTVASGDRVEVYRALEIDPRAARRALAAAGRTMADPRGKPEGGQASG